MLFGFTMWMKMLDIDRAIFLMQTEFNIVYLGRHYRL